MADDPSDGSEKDRNAPTVRELKGAGVPKDTLPDLVGVYVPPRALPEAAQHRTMDLKSVRVSDYVDPRRAPTELRLESPPRRQSWRSALWLVSAIVIAFGLGAWWLLRELTPSTVAGASQVEPPPVLVTTEVPNPRQVVSAPPSVVVAPTAVPEPPAKAASEPKAEEKASTPAPSKAQRQREVEKKRNEPWLE